MRVFQEILATAFNLKTRGISISEGCQSCGERDEIRLHAIFFCELIRQVWYDTRYSTLLDSYPRRTMAGLWLLRFDHMAKIELELMCILEWFCWYKWNKLVHGDNNRRNLASLLEATKDYLHEFQICQRGQLITSSICNKLEKWNRPPINMLKLNVDASVSNNSNHIGIGAVVRDFRGYVIVAMLFQVDFLLLYQNVLHCLKGFNLCKRGAQRWI